MNSRGLGMQLSLIAARKLRNTSGVPPRFEAKVLLAAEAFGKAAVVRDFNEWCDTPNAKAVRYPVIAYLYVMDARLGEASKTAERRFLNRC